MSRRSEVPRRRGPAVVLLHGLAMSWRAWRPLLASLQYRPPRPRADPARPPRRPGRPRRRERDLAGRLSRDHVGRGGPRPRTRRGQLARRLACARAGASRPSPQRDRGVTGRRVAQRVRPAPGPHAAAHRGRASTACRPMRHWSPRRWSVRWSAGLSCAGSWSEATASRAATPAASSVTPTPAGWCPRRCGRGAATASSPPRRCPARRASCGAAVTGSSPTSGTADR